MNGRIRHSVIVALLLAFAGQTAIAQTTSIAKQHTEVDEKVREAPPPNGNPALESKSLIAVKEAEPRKFKVNDLITVIVPLQDRARSDAKLPANLRRNRDLALRREL